MCDALVSRQPLTYAYTATRLRNTGRDVSENTYMRPNTANSVERRTHTQRRIITRRSTWSSSAPEPRKFVPPGQQADVEIRTAQATKTTALADTIAVLIAGILAAQEDW